MKQNSNYSGDSILIKRKRIYFGNAVLKYGSTLFKLRIFSSKIDWLYEMVI